MERDDDPVDSRWSLAREAASWAAHAALAPLSLVPSRHRPVRAAAIRTVVFVHGLAGNRSGFFPLQSNLWWHGHRRQLSFNYRTTGSIESLAVQLKRRLDREVRGGEIDIVAHSLGGLVARTYVQMLDGHRRVGRLITLGTPHLGSFASAWMPTRLVSQLDPDGPFLRQLNDLPPPSVAMTSVAAGKDLMVLPPRHALAPFGETVMFPQLNHLSLLLAPRVFRVVRDALDPYCVPARSGPAEKAT